MLSDASLKTKQFIITILENLGRSWKSCWRAYA